jgi:hypothetical protein
MNKLRGRRPSPAMVVAVIALSMSLVGTGVAATISVLNKNEKQQVRKISSKVANKRITARAGNLNVATADKAQNVYAATVNAGDTCSITKGTGGITAAKGGPDGGDYCDVTFPRSIENCSVGATPLHPFDDNAAVGFAGIRYLTGTTVRVTRRNPPNNFQDAGLFSIFAVCP